MVSEDWSRLREIWRSMNKRCYNPKCKDYPHYGGRGLRVCDEWQDFENFYKWAISHGYRKDLTIDRVANNKGYNPGNCRWVSRKHQANNRTTGVRYTVDGHSKSLAEWSRIYGVAPYTIIHRIEAGWTVEDAIKKPVMKKVKGKRGTRPSSPQG